MVSKKIIVGNKSGLHVRPAGVLVKAIQPFDCEVMLNFKDKQFNAKSVLGIMSACIKANEEVEFVCNGPEEEACLATIETVVTSGLGE